MVWIEGWIVFDYDSLDRAFRSGISFPALMRTVLYGYPLTRTN